MNTCLTEDEREERWVPLSEYLPKTPEPVKTRNEIAHTRQLIEARQRELDLQIRMLEAERHNLQIAWDATCEEWDRVWARGLG